MIAVVPCGSAKRSHACAAGNLYVGSFHKACMRYALSLVPPSAVYILSAKHGLISPHKVIAPYELRFGMPGAVSRERVRQQAADLGLSGDTALVLGGRDYALMTEGAFAARVVVADAVARDVPKGAMGHTIAWMARNRGQMPRTTA